MAPGTSPDSLDTDTVTAVAMIEHLTGPSRGTVSWLGQADLYITLDADGIIQTSTADTNLLPKATIARIIWNGNSHEISRRLEGLFWVNGGTSSPHQLRHHDVIEFGENGPISRYYKYDRQHRIPQTVTDILSDSRAYFRNSRQPVRNRITRVVGQTLGRLSRETTLMFRFGVILALLVLGITIYQQNRINTLLHDQIESGVAELNMFSRTLARYEEEALTPADLDLLREELGTRMTTASDRIRDLELRSGAIARVISRSVSSVVLLHGAYGFREPETDRMLRHVIDDDGLPIVLSNGIPLLSLDGTGDPAQREFFGTGFLVGGKGALITNRHVGLPWESDTNITLLVAKGLEPVMIRFAAYAPGVEEAFDVRLVEKSEETDIAILKYERNGDPIDGLPLTETQPASGNEVIVLGYPTGLRSILAQSGNAIIDELKESGDLDSWSIAARLSRAGLIIPLASRGIVGRVSEAMIAYDAETTHGGSGGPVINTDGEVIAINSAILPEYGGSNLGIPIEKVRQMLVEAELY